MSIHRFYVACDKCAVGRSEEYGALPVCTDCADDICPACTHHAVSDWDVDHRAEVVCVQCDDAQADALVEARDYSDFQEA